MFINEGEINYVAGPAGVTLYLVLMAWWKDTSPGTWEEFEEAPERGRSRKNG